MRILSLVLSLALIAPVMADPKDKVLLDMHQELLETKLDRLIKVHTSLLDTVARLELKVDNTNRKLTLLIGAQEKEVHRNTK